MDRVVNYIGQVPLDTDLLNTNKNTMLSVAMALEMILGSGTWVSGLACTPTSPASLQVLVAQGSIVTNANIDGTAYGSIIADTTHQVVKQGIVIGNTTLTIAVPSTTGQSQKYLIQAQYQDQDTDSTVLPYYNSSNPAVAYNGPNNTGVSQNTRRKGACVLNLKAGIAATTGTEATPTPDAGFTGLWVIDVANGATTIVSGNITKYPGAPFIVEKLNDKGTGAGINTRTSLTANANYYVRTDGNDSNTGSANTSGAAWLTQQHAIDYISSSIDLGGFTAAINCADGTYTNPVIVNKEFTGSGVVLLNGNTTTPTNCIISAAGGCVSVNNNAVISIQGFSLVSSGNHGLYAATGGVINVVGKMNYGATGGGSSGHITAFLGGIINIASADTVNGGGAYHLYANYNGTISINNNTTTITGTPTFTEEFVRSSGASCIWAAGNTFTGSITGVSYIASTNGVIDTLASTTFPGSAGSTATGGQFA